jgi:exodeoxyribonuclease V beta subunit
MNFFDPVKSKIEPGLTVIEASAGTGKTFSISHLVPRLLLEKPELRLSEILLVTFTTDAAGELADRTRKVFADLVSDNPPENETMAALRTRMVETCSGVDKIQQAIRELDLLSISTIHSFCQSVIQTEGELCGLPVMPEVLADWKDLVRESLHDIWKSRVASEEMLARIAGMLGWKFDEDLSFVSKVLEMPEIRVEPNPPLFEELFAGLSNPRGRFQPAEVSELEAVFDQVKWNTAGRTPEFRAAVLETLEAPGDLTGWFDAVQWVAQLDKSDSGAIRKNGDIHSRIAELQAVKTAKAILVDFKMLTLSWRKHLAEIVAEKVAANLHSNRLATFNGMVNTLDEALRGPHAETLRKRIRERFRFALVDESQDTDGAQFRIFEKIFLDSPKHSLVLIGDPKQAIYAFRGADVNTYLTAKNRPGARIFTLSATYRSPQPLVECVNALFDHSRSFHKENLDFISSSSAMSQDTWLQESADGTTPFVRLEAWIVPDTQVEDFSNDGKRLSEISKAVASEIARLLALDGVSTGIVEKGAEKPRRVVPADCAVLVSQNYEAVAIHDALKARGIPAIRKTSEDVMGSEEAREILTLLMAVNSPLQAKIRRAALATRLLGKTDEEIRATDETDKDDTVSKFQNWKLEWSRRGISTVLALIDDQESISKRLAASKDGERRLTNFRHLTDILSGFAAVSGGKPNHLLIWLEQEIARASGSGAPPDERLLQLESDSLAVKITTMHSAKGLEFPLVFCPFLWTSKTPKGYQVLNRNSVFSMVDTNLCEPELRVEITESFLEERLRLTYVALTRAQVKLWLCAGAVPGKKGSASALDWLLRSDQNIGFSAWEGVAASNRGATHKVAFQSIVEKLGGLCLVNDGLPLLQSGIYDPPKVVITDHVEPVRVPRTFWRVTSFSQLTREKNAKGDASKPPSEESGDAPQSTPNRFAALRGGAALGTAVHDFLETWNFGSVPDAAALDKHFSGYSLEKGYEDITPASADMLGHLREALLSGMDCSVEAACRTPKTSEWQFHLPAMSGFSVAKIAKVFRDNDDSEYADSLESLGSDALEGFLQGFIDKIAAYGTTYGVIDWKTNQLASYDGESLRKAARASHYWLQTHLYLVALSRYLGPQADIRGAWLIYLRGVKSGTPNSVLHIKPTPALLQGLDELFTRPNA